VLHVNHVDTRVNNNSYMSRLQNVILGKICNTISPQQWCFQKKLQDIWSPEVTYNTPLEETYWFLGQPVC